MKNEKTPAKSNPLEPWKNIKPIPLDKERLMKKINLKIFTQKVRAFLFGIWRNERMEKPVFEELFEVNVNAHLENKNGLSYLSWPYAWAAVKKTLP